MVNEGHRERLWHKLFESGFRRAFVHPYEKLEFLLTFVIPRKDTKLLAKALIARFATLSSVLLAPAESLLQVKGVGKRTATFLHMLGELYQSMSEETLKGRDLLDNIEAVSEYLQYELSGEESEVFFVVFLDADNRLLRSKRIFRGTVDLAIVFPREVVKLALAHNAKSIIVAHNHPSGNPSPSPGDLDITQRLRNALKTVDIQLHDHFVVGREGTVSLRRKHPELWR